MSPSVSPKELDKRLRNIIGERNPSSSPDRLARVEGYIEAELKSFGLSVESDPFTYYGGGYRNLIARLGPPSDAPLVILGAHYDSVEGTPGADDNASGVALLLEAAKLLSRMKPNSPVLFCAFNLEEYNMIGSGHFAKKLKAQGAKIKAMVSLEMVGYADPRLGSQQYPIGLRWFYPDRGDFIGLIGNLRSASLLRQFARSMREVKGLPVETLTVLGNGFLLPQVRLSDHSPFWDLGYPALMATDTSFFRNPHYHGPTDTLETLDLDFMAKVCEGVIKGIASL